MRRTRLWLALPVAGVLALATAPPASAGVVLADGFEDVQSVQQLLKPGRWSHLQQENGAAVTVSTARAHTGQRSLRFLAPASGDVLTKSDIAKNDVTFRLGDVMDVSAWFYIERAGALTDLFLIDAECANCGVQSPGLRVMLSNGYPVIERGELLLSTIRQQVAQVSKGRWFHIRFRLTIGLARQGHMTLWVDGRKVIDGRGTTVFPVGAQVSDVQIGLTANPTSTLAEMYADDVLISRIPRQRLLSR